MSPRILVIDDEPSVRLLLTHALSDRVDVVCAATGREGFARIAEDSSFAALFSDLNLPDISGAFIVRTVRALRPGLPIVMVTADDADSVAWSSGADVLLQKPFRLADLDAALERALSGGSADLQAI